MTLTRGDVTGMKLAQAAQAKTAADELAAKRDALLDELTAKDNAAFVRFLLANQSDLMDLIAWWHYLPVTEAEEAADAPAAEDGQAER